LDIVLAPVFTLYAAVEKSGTESETYLGSFSTYREDGEDVIRFGYVSSEEEVPLGNLSDVVSLPILYTDTLFIDMNAGESNLKQYPMFSMNMPIELMGKTIMDINVEPSNSCSILYDIEYEINRSTVFRVQSDPIRIYTPLYANTYSIIRYMRDRDITVYHYGDNTSVQEEALYRSIWLNRMK